MAFVNSTTMLFDHLTTGEATELERILDVINSAKVSKEPVWLHPLVDQWCCSCDFNDDDKKLLVISTVFPARAGLSLAKYWRARAEATPQQ